MLFFIRIPNLLHLETSTSILIVAISELYNWAT